MTPVLELRDVCVQTSAGVDIITDISLAVSAGRIMGLVGESGSGKSTTALAALGHARRGVRITSGEVRLLDEDLLTLTAARLRARRGKVVAYVPQNPPNTLNPGMRIGDHLTEMAAEHSTNGADIGSQIGETLDSVRLPTEREFLRRFPHQLSGGQQQRVVLALAFICRPSVVVLDEPTTGLDVTTQRHILTTIRRLCEQFETAALYVSHDLAVVAQLADDVSVMYAGRVVERASSPSLFRTPAHPYSRALLSAVPDVHGQMDVRGIAGAAPPPGRRPRGCEFWPRCEFAVEECRKVAPGVVLLADGRESRCYRAKEVITLGALERPERVPSRTLRADRHDAALAIEGLEAYHGKRQVLRDLTFQLRPGSCLAVVGESGSGKTTLARCIVGLHRQATGAVRLRGQALSFDVRRRTKAQRRDVQIVFQNPDSSLNPRRTVEELLTRPVELFLGLRGSAARARVPELLERVALSAGLRDRYPYELSGGEQQRVAIARALAAEPAILVCDEVTSSLDVSVQASMIELLRDLRLHLGLTIMFITHNLALVHLIADSLLVMKEGLVVESGAPSSVLEHPRAEYTRQLLDSSPEIPVRDQAGSSKRNEEA
jgi:peptide/nickel transport system ATP-binding protein